MLDTLNMKRCIASIALFKELNKKNKDIYIVLSEFIKNLIVDKKKQQFSVKEITRDIKDYYGFEIPEGVVRTSIKLIHEVENGGDKYFLKTAIPIENELLKKRKNLEDENSSFLTSLISYIETKKGRELQKSEHEQATKAFCDFLLDDKYLSNDYSKFVSAYILQNRSNVEFIKKLDSIRQGVLLYSALQYSPEEYKKNSWDRELVLYLDTEILFSIYGFNGPLFQKMAKEMLDLIDAVNKRSMKQNKTKMIELYYFEEIKIEIDNYFRAAEINLRKKEREYQTKDAMIAIMNGCSDGSDVIEKKALFYKKLEYLEIFEDPQKEYYNKTDVFYGIESEKVINEISRILVRKYTNKDIEYCLNLLNKISQLRKDNNRKRANVKYYLLTGKSMYINITNCKVIKTQDNPITLSLSMERLTEDIWIRLNKGFGDANLINFNVITRSQIILEDQLQVSVSEKYKDLLQRYKNKEIDEDDANAILFELRKYRAIKEDIDDINADEIIAFTEESIERYLETQQYLEQIREQTSSENQVLREALESSIYQLDIYKKSDQEKMERRNKRIAIWNRSKWLITFFVIIMIICISIIYKMNAIVIFILGSLATINLFFGIMKWFGLDYQKIKGLLTKTNKDA